jgi:hypothetical protein
LRELTIPQEVPKFVAVEATGGETAVHSPMEGRQIIEASYLHGGEIARGVQPGRRRRRKALHMAQPNDLPAFIGRGYPGAAPFAKP